MMPRIRRKPPEPAGPQFGFCATVSAPYSSAGPARGTPVLSVDGGPQDGGPHAVIVGMVVGGPDEVLERGRQFREVPLVEPQHRPAEPDPAVLAGLLGQGGRVDVGPGRL